MNKEVLQMRTEISALQKTYDTRETKFIEESTSYADNVETLHTLIEKAEERLEEGWDPQRSVSETLRFQVENLELQLQSKEASCDNLRQEAIKALNEQRKSVTDAVTKFRAYLTHMSEHEQMTEQKYQDFLDERF